MLLVMSNDKKKEASKSKEVLSFCGKCKLALAHTIISTTKKGTVDRCECKTCGAAHKYRDPDKATKPKAKRASKKASVSIDVLWNEAISNATGPSKPYKMSADFAEGDLIDHPTFGKGVVRELIDHNKIKVIFECSEKLMAKNRQ